MAFGESPCRQAIAYLKAKESGPSADEACLPIGDTPVVTDLGGGLCVTYVIDRAPELVYIRNRDAAEAGLSTADIHGMAVENLAALARQRLRITPYGNIFAVMLDGNFEASLILVDSLWEKGLAHLAPRGFVAAIPARDILAFCDRGSDAGIIELGQLVERVGAGDHMVSRALHARIGRTWQPI